MAIPGPRSEHTDSETGLKAYLHRLFLLADIYTLLYPPNKLLFACLEAHGGITSFARFSPGTSANRGTPYSAHPHPLQTLKCSSSYHSVISMALAD